MALLVKNATLPSGKKADVLIEGNRISKISSSIASSGAE